MAVIIVKEFNLPNDYTNIISMEIRRQIKEYVFGLFSGLSLTYSNIKEGVYKSNNSTAIVQEKKKENKISIFATYRNYEVVERNYKTENKLPYVTQFLFDANLENNITNLRMDVASKPKFLENKIRIKKSVPIIKEFVNNSEEIIEKEANEIVIKIEASPSKIKGIIKLFLYIIDKIKLKKKRSNSSTLIRLNHDILYSLNEDDNPNIIKYDNNTITISKEVMNKIDWYDKIIIDKSILKIKQEEDI